MIKTFLTRVERFRLLAMLLLTLCAYATAKAQLESACLKEGSIPIVFENDSDNPWIAEDGYIRSTNENVEEESTSTISTTFTLDKASVFSFECRNLRTTTYSSMRFIIDGIEYDRYGNGTTWHTVSVVLYPGKHTLEFINWHRADSDINYRKNNVSEIRNVCLDQTWYSVSLTMAGELRPLLIEALGEKNLQDVELLKISGPMNDDDWSLIQQLVNIKAIDFTETDITLIPDYSMYSLAHLSTVMLPETLKEIGRYVFERTNFHRVTIPSSVERIGTSAWSDTPLQFIDFEKDSKLKTIGFSAFSNTRLLEFDMPNSVVEISRAEPGMSGDGNRTCTFYECKSLKKIRFSDKLTRIPQEMFFTCSSLEDVELPPNLEVIESRAFYGNSSLKTIQLPETLLSIQYAAFNGCGFNSIKLPDSLLKLGYKAFSETLLDSIVIPQNVWYMEGLVFAGCTELKKVTLQPLAWDLSATFENCTALDTVVIPCPTPPSILRDPFSLSNSPYSRKDQVKIIVPDFAVDAYRGDPYWYQLAYNTFSTNETSVRDYWGVRGNLTLDTKHTIQGRPSMEVWQGASVTIDQEIPQNLDMVKYNTSESSPASFISRSNAVKANGLEVTFEFTEKDKWYYFAPVTDVNMSDMKYSSTDSWIIYSYDGARRASENTATGNWVRVPSDGKLKRGQGYIFQAAVAGVLTMPAATSEHDKFFGNDEVSLALAENPCESAVNAGWNFVANPYPCYYDIYYMDMEAPVTVWNGSTYRAYSLSGGDRADNTLVLRPMQPFFVQKSASDVAAGMTLEGRRTSSVINRTGAPRKTVTDPDRHKFNLELFCEGNDDPDDYTSIVINEKASLSYETKCDASKFMSMDNSVGQFYTLGENRNPMALNERPFDNGSVGLGIYLPKSDATYRISASRADRGVWIHDAETGIEQDLTQGDYLFSASRTGTDDSRFTLRFAPAVNSVESVNVEDVKAVGGKGFITVNAPAGTDIMIYSADGKLVTLTTAGTDGAIVSATPGVYVVKVNDLSSKIIVK